MHGMESQKPWIGLKELASLVCYQKALAYGKTIPEDELNALRIAHYLDKATDEERLPTDLRKYIVSTYGLDVLKARYSSSYSLSDFFIYDSRSPNCLVFDNKKKHLWALSNNRSLVFNLEEKTTIKKPIQEFEYRKVGDCYGAVLADNGLYAGFKHNPIKKYDKKLQKWEDVSPDSGKAVNCLVLSKEGQQLYCGSEYGTIVECDLNKKLLPLLFVGKHLDRVNSLMIDKKGNFLYSASSDNTIGIWDVEKRAYIKALRGHEKAVTCLASNSTTQLYSGSKDNSVRVWDLNSDTCTHIFQGHSASVQCLAFNADTEIICSGAVDGTVRMWNMSNNTCVCIICLGTVSSLVFDGAHNALYAGLFTRLHELKPEFDYKKALENYSFRQWYALECGDKESFMKLLLEKKDKASANEAKNEELL